MYLSSTNHFYSSQSRYLIGLFPQNCSHQKSMHAPCNLSHLCIRTCIIRWLPVRSEWCTQKFLRKILSLLSKFDILSYLGCISQSIIQEWHMHALISDLMKLVCELMESCIAIPSNTLRLDSNATDWLSNKALDFVYWHKSAQMNPCFNQYEISLSLVNCMSD